MFIFPKYLVSEVKGITSVLGKVMSIISRYLIINNNFINYQNK